MRYWWICCLWITGSAHAQLAGGSSVYNFLQLSANPLHTAIGGQNISVISKDVSMGYQQPALIRKELDQQYAFVFSALQAGIKHIHFSGSVYSERLATAFAASVQYFNYGNISQTDASGNELGTITPRDYVLQVGASRQYGRHWHYGAAVKFIQSNYGIYRSSAIAMDLGVNYYDSSRLWQAGLLMKNMGTQLVSYTGEGKDNLPFDLQLGITKRLARAPLQFSLTAIDLHHLLLNGTDSSGGFDRAMQHFVIGTQFFIGDKIELAAGYNHMKRRELSIPNTANGLTGFSMGIGILLPRLQIRYARAYQSNSRTYNQIGLQVDFSTN
jgi:hypothetical protein